MVRSMVTATALEPGKFMATHAILLGSLQLIYDAKLAGLVLVRSPLSEKVTEKRLT